MQHKAIKGLWAMLILFYPSAMLWADVPLSIPFQGRLTVKTASLPTCAELLRDGQAVPGKSKTVTLVPDINGIFTSSLEGVNASDLAPSGQYSVRISTGAPCPSGGAGTTLANVSLKSVPFALLADQANRATLADNALNAQNLSSTNPVKITGPAVGIGTDTPADGRTFHLYKDKANEDLRTRFENKQENAFSILELVRGPLTWQMTLNPNSQSDNLTFQSSPGPGSGKYISISTTAELGIGVDKPTAKLDVRGNAKVFGNMQVTGGPEEGTIEAKTIRAETVRAENIVGTGSVEGVLPEGAIIIWASTGTRNRFDIDDCPKGFRERIDFEGRFPIGSESPDFLENEPYKVLGRKGGSKTHTHGISLETQGNKGVERTSLLPVGDKVASDGHKHDIRGDTGDPSNLHPYITVLFCSKCRPKSVVPVESYEYLGCYKDK